MKGKEIRVKLIEVSKYDATRKVAKTERNVKNIRGILVKSLP